MEFEKVVEYMNNRLIRHLLVAKAKYEEQKQATLARGEVPLLDIENILDVEIILGLLQRKEVPKDPA